MSRTLSASVLITLEKSGENIVQFRKNDFFYITISFWYCVFRREQRSHVSLSTRLNFTARFAFVYCKMRTKINYAQVLSWEKCGKGRMKILVSPQTFGLRYC